MSRIALPLIALMGMLVGCQSGSRVVAWHCTDRVSPNELAQTQTSEPLTLVRLSGCNDARLLKRSLGPAAPVGFDRDDAGRLRAVAGNERIAIAEGDYEWHGRAIPEPIDFDIVDAARNVALIPVALGLMALSLMLTGSLKC